MIIGFGSVTGRTHVVYGVVRPCVELKSIIIYFLRRVLDNGDFLAPPLPGPLPGVSELSRPRFALEVFTAGANDFFIFAFSRPSPVVGHVTHSSGELCVSLGMVSQLTPASIFG